MIVLNTMRRPAAPDARTAAFARVTVRDRANRLTTDVPPIDAPPIDGPVVRGLAIALIAGGVGCTLALIVTTGPLFAFAH
ncbi:MAG: hypothetical protein ING59_16545 [Burkholderiales bacterium]|nr:hypothetical protein [Burkholderiales bacterium]